MSLMFQTIDAVSTSALDQFPANIVLPDDMMTLTLDAVSTAQLHMVYSLDTNGYYLKVLKKN